MVFLGKGLRNINPDFLENFKVDKANKSYGNSGKGTPIGIEVIYALKSFIKNSIISIITHVGKNGCLSNDPLDYPFFFFTISMRQSWD